MSKSIKIILSSDWHIDVHTAGVPRLDDFYNYIYKLRQAIEKEKADYFIFSGDIHDPGQRLDALYSSVLIRVARQLTEATKIESFWIAGNHDVIEVDGYVTTLSPLCAADLNRCCVIEEPEFLITPHFNLLALPYVARASYDQKVLDEVILEAACDQNNDKPLVVVGHLTVPGAKMGSESTDMARGRDIDFPVEKIRELKPDLVINGHYHQAQVVKSGGLDILIPGSPFKMNFGEAEDTNKGYTVVELEA